MRENCRLIGTSVAMRLLDEEIDCAARSDAKILISGESGTGKEVTARLIHTRGARCRAPLVTINCAGLPDSLIESELFGHVRGSFTGAYRDKAGLVEIAHRGTLFMDEVGEMSLRMQGLLLRFLETGEIERVGADHAKPRADVRVIAATNRNLVDSVASKAFREDLYYRLNVIHLLIPPLRDRREDIPVLLESFFQAYGERYGIGPPPIGPDALERLVAYDWPGNVRELKNVVERLVVRFRKGTITAADLPAELAQLPGAAAKAAPEIHRVSPADVMFDRIVTGGESFWAVVYDPFMSRDLTRDDLRLIVRKGLEQTHGSYTLLVQLFNMGGDDYKRFLNFLRKHGCHMPFQRFRSLPARLSAEPPVPAHASSPAGPSGGFAERRNSA